MLGEARSRRPRGVIAEAVGVATTFFAGMDTPDHNQRPHERAAAWSNGRDTPVSARPGHATLGSTLFPAGGITPGSSPSRTLHGEHTGSRTPASSTRGSPRVVCETPNSDRGSPRVLFATPNARPGPSQADAITVRDSPVRARSGDGAAAPRARTGQRASSLPPERSPGLGDSDGFEAESPDPKLKRAALQRAVEAAGAKRELLMPEGLSKLTERGGKTSTADIVAQELDRECDKLAATFEPWDLQKAIGYDDSAFDQAEPEEILRALRRKVRAAGEPAKSVARARCTYAAVRTWLARRDLDAKHAEQVPEHLLLLYLEEYKASKLAKKAEGQPAAPNSTDDERDAVPVVGARRHGKRKQTLQSAGDFIGAGCER